MNCVQTIAAYVPSKGCVIATRNAVSFSTVLLVTVLCLTAGTTPVFGHATACGNINNEKVFVNALYADILGRDPYRADFRLLRNRRKTDVAVWRPSNGTWYVWSSQFGTYKGTPHGQAGDRLVPADYDGDGKTDIAVYRPSNGTWYLLRSQAGSAQMQYGVSTDIPVPADYDGDNRVDLAYFRPSECRWYMKRSASGNTDEQFGASGDKPIPNAYGQ